nr:MAG: major capsid protein [Microviridae sp.]
MNVNKVNKYTSTVETTTRRLNKFYQPHGLHTTFDSGKLIPIYLKEVLPNDVRKLKWSSVVRLMTPKFPTMDNAKIDTFFFYVRNRDIWDDWSKFMGENKDPWAISNEPTVPQITIPLKETSRNVGDLADYLGIPVAQTSMSSDAAIKVSALPFRAVCKIWNDYFRDENYQSELYFPRDNYEASYMKYNSSDDFTSQVFTGAVCPPVNRYKDYFSSCLPAPQKGQAVQLPLGDYAPVELNGGSSVDTKYLSEMKLYSSNGTVVQTPTNSFHALVYGGANQKVCVQSASSAGSVYENNTKVFARANLSSATAASVNAIRLAFQSQRFLEQSARGGTRYTELLVSMFGVNAPDLMMNRAEFLGGKSFPLSLTPVTDVGSNLGNVGGMSSTVSGDYAFKKHFNEHGYIIGFACVRTDRSYSQGVNPLWFRKEKTDYYFPVFSHIGEQPVYKRELYALDVPNRESVFGYKEAWTEYRISFNENTGYMRSDITDTLNVWTYGDFYTNTPVLNSAWLTYQKEIIDRTITNQNKHQFIADFWFDDTLYSVVSKNSNPGLIDHY